jgi:predicted type IV restriction endonuclease
VNEAETRAELIDPALKDAGWGVVAASRVRREVITLGGQRAANAKVGGQTLGGQCQRGQVLHYSISPAGRLS